MFPPSSPSSANSVLLLLTTAVILVASAAVASPVSREEQNALEQPAPSKRLKWRTIEGDANDYDGDALEAGFRDISPEALKRFASQYIMHKRIPIHKRMMMIPLHKRMPIPIHKRYNNGLAGFHGDTFSDGFGQFGTVRRKKFTNSFHGDTFSDGFGDFATV